MKKYFVDYLNSIGVTNVLKEKINEFYEFYHFICPEDVKEIFITDNIREDGERTYDKTCFFSENFYMEARVFQKKDNFFIAPLKSQIINLSIEKKCYNFKKATEDSRLAVFVNFPEEEKWLAATKNNCDHLRDIMLEYFVPNLQSYQKTFLMGGREVDLLEAEIEEIDSLEKQSKLKKHIRSHRTFRIRDGIIEFVSIDKEKKEPQEKI